MNLIGVIQINHFEAQFLSGSLNKALQKKNFIVYGQAVSCSKGGVQMCFTLYISINIINSITVTDW